MRAAAGTGQVAAVAWPVAHGVASGLIGFVSGEQRPPADIRDRMREKVPPYMLPSVIYAIDEIPHTANGKIDRKTLLTGLGDGRYH